MFRHAYRAGLTDTESKAIQSLRRRGFAVVLFAPSEVGHPLNRSVIEKRMLEAGREVCQQTEEQKCS